MALPLKYNIRNILVRWRSTLTTVLGVAMVVAVYMVIQAMAVGLEKSSASTGDPRNLLIVRKGATAESSSVIGREQLKLLQYAPEIAHNSEDKPLISADSLVLINLPRKGQAGEANVLLRGVSPRGLELRPQVKLTAGRWFVPGKREVVVSKRLSARFANFDIGQSFKSGPTTLTVVGLFDAGTSAFDSELWLDADECLAMFDRESYSSLLVRLVNDQSRESLVKRIEGDKQLQLRVFGEVEYYKEQTRTATPIRWLGNFLAVAMSIGAVFAAMNTMYASIAARTREVGTLRVLGFHRRTIVFCFLVEGAFLSLIGGIIGVAVSLKMNGYAAGTMGFESFSETVFQFTITPVLMLKGLLFSVMVGLFGSLLPALRASRIPVISALKTL